MVDDQGAGLERDLCGPVDPHHLRGAGALADQVEPVHALGPAPYYTVSPEKPIRSFTGPCSSMPGATMLTTARPTRIASRLVLM